MRPICSQESCPLDWRVTLADGPLCRVRRAGRMGLVKGMAVSRGPRACQAQSPWRGGRSSSHTSTHQLASEPSSARWVSRAAAGRPHA